MFRIFHTTYILFKYFILYSLSKLHFHSFKKQEFLKHFFEELGGSFIKFGQLLALRVDIIPKEYALAMLDLFDNIKPVSYSQIEQIFISELGAKPEEIFTKFEKKPFASASFGQVHAAQLGTDILAVKILRPGIYEEVQIDFIFINILASIGDMFFKINAMPWKEFAVEFKEWTLKELDYHIEAEHTNIMYQKHQDISKVIIPKIYPRYSTKKILVEEYIDGIPLSRVLRGLKDGRLDKEKLLKIGIDVKKVAKLMGQILVIEYFNYGIFHADPHPGNILLLKNNKIALIDFGILGQAIPYQRKEYIQFLLCVINSQFKEGILHFFNATGYEFKNIIESILPATVDPSYINNLFKLIAEKFTDSVSLKIQNGITDINSLKSDYTAFLLDMMTSANLYKIKLPKESIGFLRALSIFGLLAKQLDINFKMTDEIKDFFEKNPPEKFSPEYNSLLPYKRMNREKALELFNNWLSLLFEKDPTMYEVVKKYIDDYNKS